MTYILGLLPLAVNVFCLRSLPFGRCLVFLDDSSWVFVFSTCDETCMTEMVVGGPLQKAELCDGFRAEPCAVLHLCSRQTLTPAPGAGFGKIDERTFCNL